MTLTVRSLAIVSLISLGFSLLIGVTAMSHILVIGRVLGILAILFSIVGYVLFRFLLRNSNVDLGISSSGHSISLKKGVASFSLIMGLIYLLSGTTAILLGTIVRANQDAFWIAGAVVCCFGGYALLIAFRARTSREK